MKKTGEISNILKNIEEINIDLSKLNDDYFYDIKNQRKYINDVNSWSLYCSLGFKGFRKLKLEKPNSMTLIALIFSLLVKVYHFPRLLKQKYFPGLGKQNYT